MKLLSLDIEDFGIYGQRQFAFRDGLQLIYGPNEAGKSTLLALIRQLFFGFPHRNSYQFPQHNGRPLAATAHLQLLDGRRVRFRRQKGQPDGISGEVAGGTRPLDAAAWSQLLGAAHDLLFQHVFAFSQSELAQGQESLQAAHLEQALFGSGLGGLAVFRRVQSQIRGQHEQLYTVRGRTRTINKLLDDLRARNRQYREALVKPRDYDELRNVLEDHQRQAEHLAAECAQLLAADRRLERLDQALPSFRQWRRLQEQLEQLRLPAGWTRGVAEQFDRTTRRLGEIDAELAEVNDRLICGDAATEAPRPNPELLASEAAIRRLSQDLGHVRSLLNELPGVQQQLERLEVQIAARLDNLHPAGTQVRLPEQAGVSLPQRETALRLAEEHARLLEQQAALNSRRPDLDQQLQHVQRRLSALTGVDQTAALDALLEQANAYRAGRQRRQDVLQQIDNLREQRARLHTQLAGPLQLTVADVTALPVPLPATVTEFRQRCEGSEAAAGRARERVAQLRSELVSVQEELARFDAAQHVSTRGDLSNQRSRRDAGWELIRQKFVEGAAIDDAALAWCGHADAPGLAECYEIEVHQADLLADAQLDNAEWVAQRNQLVNSIERQEARLAEADEERAAAERAVAQQLDAWREVWSNCGFTPLSPAAMQDWLRTHAACCELSAGLATQQAARARIDAELARFESELARAFPEHRDHPDAALAAAQLRLQEQRLAHAERQRLHEQQGEIALRVESLERAQFELSLHLADWQSRRRALLAELLFPDHWDIAVLARVLTELSEVQRLRRELSAIREQWQRGSGTLQAFEAAVAALCSRAAPDLAGFPAADAVATLVDRLDAARRLELERLQHQAARSADERLRSLRSQQQQELQGDLTRLVLQLGLSDADELHALAAAAQRAEHLREGLDECDRAVRRFADADADAFLADLAQADMDLLQSQRSRLAGDLAEMQQAYRREVEAAGIARDRLEALQRDDRALQLASDVQSLQAQLAAQVDRWAPLVLTAGLMQRALERFEKTQQPRLLADVGELFERMTLGEYTGVRRTLEDRGRLLVEHRSRALKEPGQLSTGAREQLYLAIRLAYVREYCRESEPLPVVMDDVLVNFDEDRARQTLDVLCEFAPAVQVLLLTCHRRTVELLRGLRPEMVPLELVPGALAAGTDTIETPPPVAARAVRPTSRKTPRDTEHPLLFPQP